MNDTRPARRLAGKSFAVLAGIVILAAAVGGTLIGAAAVYVRGGFDGNAANPPEATQATQTAVNCAPSVKAAGLLAPLVKGQVAAFQVATEPVSLAGLAFKRADGTATTIADFAGRTVLLNTWATWCLPCRKEMPALDSLENAVAAPDFAVVAVSIDTQGPDKPANFLQQIGIKRLPLFTDPTTKVFGDLKSHAMAVGLPTTVLIDAKGCALGVMSGPAEWDSPDARALVDAARKSV